MNEYHNEKFKAILLIDFDQTIANSNYPEIIGLKEYSKQVMNKLYDDGFFIIINTCRTGSEENRVVEFLNKNGIKFHLINKNHAGLIEYFREDSRKLSGDIHIDDKDLSFAYKGFNGLNWDHYVMINNIASRPNFKSLLNYIGRQKSWL